MTDIEQAEMNLREAEVEAEARVKYATLEAHTARIGQYLIFMGVLSVITGIVFIAVFAADCSARQTEAYEETVQQCIAQGSDPLLCRMGPVQVQKR